MLSRTFQNTDCEVVSLYVLVALHPVSILPAISKSGCATEVNVSFRVDPAILGGLIVRVDDKVMDGSVAGQLESLRQSLH